MVNTILARRVNHIVAKGGNPAWPKGSKSRGFSNGRIDALGSPAQLKRQFHGNSMYDVFYALARTAKRGD